LKGVEDTFFGAIKLIAAEFRVPIDILVGWKLRPSGPMRQKYLPEPKSVVEELRAVIINAPGQKDAFQTARGRGGRGAL
jgi:hypothetical protein